MMNTFLSKNLSYVLLPGKPGFDSPLQTLHDKAFAFWLPLWSEVYQELGSDKKKPTVDDLFRQDCVGLLMYGDQIIGMHTYTFFDLKLKSTPDHSYFSRYYSEEVLEDLRKRGATKVMSMEFFAVHPDWRSTKSVGVTMAAVVASLGLKVFSQIKADVAVSVARQNVGAVKMSHALGAVSIARDITVHNTPCDIIAFFPGAPKPFAEDAVNSLANTLWENRKDFVFNPSRQDGAIAA